MVSVCFCMYMSLRIFPIFLAGFQVRVKHMQETHGFLKLGNYRELTRNPKNWLNVFWMDSLKSFQLARFKHWIHWGPKVVLKRKAISKAE